MATFSPVADPFPIGLDKAVLFFSITNFDKERSNRIVLSPPWLPEKVSVGNLCQSPHLIIHVSFTLNVPWHADVPSHKWHANWLYSHVYKSE